MKLTRNEALEQEPTTKNETLVSLDVYKQVAKERDIAIQQLHELGYDFGQKIEPTTKNDLGVDCIDRQATLDAIIKRLGIKNETYLLEAERVIYQQILAMPSVTPQEPKTGHWIEDAEQHHVEKTYHCSECGHGAWGEYEKTEYCGGCGAKMVEPTGK